MINFFPYYLERVAASEVRLMLNGSSTRLIEIANEIFYAEAKHASEKQNISEFLYDLISRQIDTTTQNALLKVRRDIYNDRGLKSNLANSIKHLLDSDLSERIKTISDIKDQLSILKGKFYQEYLIATDSARIVFQQLSCNNNLRNAIALSSPNFVEYLDHYSKYKGRLNKSELTTELTIVKYVTRSATKTSPFSSFTHASIFKFNNIQNNQVFKKNKIANVLSLNNFLFSYLKDVLAVHRAFYLEMDFRVNPTLTKVDKYYKFLTNSKNVEAFQIIHCNPFLDFILNLFGSSYTNKNISLANIIDDVLQQVDSSRDEIYSYLRRLINVGLLQPCYGINNLDPDWALKLANLIKSKFANEPDFVEISNLISDLQNEMNNFRISESRERANILKDLHSRIVSTCNVMLKGEQILSLESSPKNVNEQNYSQADTTKEFQQILHRDLSLSPKSLFYEDTSIKLSVNLDYEEVTALSKIFIEFFNAFQCKPLPDVDQLRVLEYFKSEYNQNEVNILEFYEAYARNVERPIEQYEKKRKLGEEIAIEVPKFYKILSYEQQLEQHYGTINETISRLNLNCSDLVVNIDATALPKMEEHIISSSMQGKSFGMFVQLEYGTSGLSGIVNGVALGYGKYFSRFLAASDPEVIEDLKIYNQSVQPANTISCENCDDSHFNANIHPFIQEFELELPNAENRQVSEKILKLKDLNLRLIEDKVCMIHQPTGKRVKIFDLTYQALFQRSRLFRLINSIAGVSENIVYFDLLRAINARYTERAGGTGGALQVIPRIVWAKRIVLQRKAWIFTKAALPTSNVDEEFQLEIMRWRKLHDLPLRVFVSIPPDNPEIIKKDDNYKPQFIDLSNPILVILLKKLINKPFNNIKFSEMLPDETGLLMLNDEARVCEHFFQWYYE